MVSEPLKRYLMANATAADPRKNVSDNFCEILSQGLEISGILCVEFSKIQKFVGNVFPRGSVAVALAIRYPPPLSFGRASGVLN